MNNKYLRVFLFGVVATLFFGGCSTIPKSYDNPVDYLDAVFKLTGDIRQDMWDYVRTSVHVKDIREVNNSRLKVVETIEKAISQVEQIEPYDGDFILKSAVLEYLYLQVTVLKEDYGKIIDMKEIAQNSYDIMEAYLLAQRTAGQKLEESGIELEEKQRVFASNYNVTLMEKEDEISKKLKTAAEVSDYFDQVFLIFFKSSNQEWHLIEAIQDEDFSRVEQLREALISYTEEGLAKLDTLEPFKGDDSVLIACRQALEFFNKEAKESIPVFQNFMEKQSHYQQLLKAFEAKDDSEKTQEDVNILNAKVDELNKLVPEYELMIEKMNEEKGRVIGGWNQVSEAFNQRHIPM
jgi:hypothetical protein